MFTRSFTFLLLAPLFLLSACSTMIPKEYVVSQSQLARAWAKSFPLQRQLGNGLMSTTIAMPEVGFLAAQNRVSLATNFSASSVLVGGLQGRIGLTGALRYDPAQRALYMQDPNLETLQVAQGSDALGETLRPVLNMMLSEYLRSNPLYQFKEDEMHYAGTDIDITSVEVVASGIKFHIKPR
ncbi:MAG: DUF1439 domain-containing protein [Sideroxydans sp.]|nr:DUF1439 domain-containing protein [Sideroxydans sp.]